MNPIFPFNSNSSDSYPQFDDRDQEVNGLIPRSQTNVPDSDFRSTNDQNSNSHSSLNINQNFFSNSTHAAYCFDSSHASSSSNLNDFYSYSSLSDSLLTGQYSGGCDYLNSSYMLNADNYVSNCLPASINDFPPNNNCINDMESSSSSSSTSTSASCIPKDMSNNVSPASFNSPVVIEATKKTESNKWGHVNQQIKTKDLKRRGKDLRSDIIKSTKREKKSSCSSAGSIQTIQSRVDLTQSVTVSNIFSSSNIYSISCLKLELHDYFKFRVLNRQFSKILQEPPCLANFFSRSFSEIFDSLERGGWINGKKQRKIASEKLIEMARMAGESLLSIDTSLISEINNVHLDILGAHCPKLTTLKMSCKKKFGKVSDFNFLLKFINLTMAAKSSWILADQCHETSHEFEHEYSKSLNYVSIKSYNKSFKSLFI